MNQTLPALLLQATLHHKAARLPEAAALYRQILTADPTHADALHQFGVLAYQRGEHNAAAELIGRALIQHSGHATFHNSLGSVYLESGRHVDAAKAFRQALNLAPDSFEIRNNLANALHAAGALTEAIAHYHIALEAAPGNPDIHNNLGRTFYFMGDVDNAADHFRMALKARPEDAEILGNLGNALRGLGRLPEAAEAYRHAVAISPTTPDLHKSLGITLSLLGDQAGGEESLRTALTLNPTDAAIEALGHSYYALGKLESAVSAFRHTLKRQPDNRDCRFSLGIALNDLGRHAEGLEAIAKGPGLAHLSLSPAAEQNAIVAPARVVTQTAPPDFIGRWFIGEPSLCERLIDFFEERTDQHLPGRTNYGVNTVVKHSRDLVIFPNDLEMPGYEPVQDYLGQLGACWRDYAAQWPLFGEMLQSVDLVPFNIQRYDIGGHFQKPHCERFGVGVTYRVLAWMTYLNDVAEGGETLFHHYGLSIRPERGKTLIWPAEWTHVHAGAKVLAGQKYIITGWMHFPHPAYG